MAVTKPTADNVLVPPLMVKAPCELKVVLLPEMMPVFVTVSAPVGALRLNSVLADNVPEFVMPIAPPAVLVTVKAPAVVVSEPTLFKLEASTSIDGAEIDPAAVLETVPPTAFSLTTPAGVKAPPITRV